MNNIFAQISFSLGITGPIFIVLILGWLFRRLNIIQPQFIKPASDLVFKVGLPTILFLSIYRADTEQFVVGLALLIIVPVTLFVFFLSEAVARTMRLPNADRGVFVQGAFRGNLGIIGLAFCSSTYGDAGLAAAALPVAVLTTLYNLLAIVTLSSVQPRGQQSRLKQMLRNTLRNPLLIGIGLGFLMKFSTLTVPGVIERTGDYFSAMTLPLALLCIGASINLQALRHSRLSTTLASSIKMLLTPALVVAIALGMGLRGIDLGILFFLASAPTATASFIQVKAMGGNGDLAANIIVMTTLLAIVTISLGLSLLKATAVI